MAVMTVVYRTPTDPEAFRRDYFDVHVPFATQLPGLRDYQVSHGVHHRGRDGPQRPRARPGRPGGPTAGPPGRGVPPAAAGGVALPPGFFRRGAP